MADSLLAPRLMFHMDNASARRSRIGILCCITSIIPVGVSRSRRTKSLRIRFTMHSAAVIPCSTSLRRVVRNRSSAMNCAVKNIGPMRTTCLSGSSGRCLAFFTLVFFLPHLICLKGARQLGQEFSRFAHSRIQSLQKI